MNRLKFWSSVVLCVFLGSVVTVSASYIIPNGGVTTAKIASQAVTTAKIANGAVTNTQLGSNSVANGNIQSAAVATGNIQSQAITQGLLALRSTGTTVGAGGVAISSSSGIFTTTSTSPVDVTNLSVTITTTGRPVVLNLEDDNTGSSSVSATGNLILVQFLRAGVDISQSELSNAAGFVSIPPGSFKFLDVISAGTYTYKVQTNVSSGGTSQFNHVVLVAYEL